MENPWVYRYSSFLIGPKIKRAGGRGSLPCDLGLNYDTEFKTKLAKLKNDFVSTYDPR